jgi:pimeloyl-ACP methyl ester carboxylesterase
LLQPLQQRMMPFGPQAQCIHHFGQRHAAFKPGIDLHPAIETLLAEQANLYARRNGHQHAGYREALNADPVIDARYTEDFAQRLPVQILWGENDEWQPVGYANPLQADIPDARLQVIPRAGHFLMEDAPETVAQLLAAFIHSL